MVLLDNYKDFFVFELPSKNVELNLPSPKDIGLKLSYVGKEYEEVIAVYKGTEPILPFAASNVFNSPIKSFRRLTAIRDDCKPVYEITFDVTDSNFKFKAGDTIGIIPRNKDEEVNFILNHLNITAEADQLYEITLDTSVKAAKLPSHIPMRSSVRFVLTNCIDIRSIVKKLFLMALSRFTKNENEKRILEYLCSAQGSAMYNTHILNKTLSIIDLFKILPSCKPPVELLLANLPRLLPRAYSIVNSGLKDSNKINICFSVMEVGFKRKGLTTGWLESIVNREKTLEDFLKSLNINGRKSTKVSIYIRKNMGSFSLPVRNLENPIIFIGAGTGVSPFLGFLEEIEYLKQNFNRKVGFVWLFFGCRDPKLDFLYKEEINSFISNGTLDKFSQAFSRIDNNGIKYVQDAVLANSEEIAKLIENGASIFVSGDVRKMASQVKEAIAKCLTTHGGKSLAESELFIANMEKDKRYIVELWN